MSVKSDTGPFALVPEWLLRMGLSSRAVHLYAVLSRCADNDTRRAFPSRDFLRQRLGCSVKSIDRTLSELRDARAIGIKPRRDTTGQHSNLYTVHRAAPMSFLSPPLDAGDEPPLDTGVAQNKNQSELEESFSDQADPEPEANFDLNLSHLRAIRQ